MRKRHLSDIRVKDICAEAKITRQTFYYHFKDKYDLVSWIYLRDMPAGSADLSSIASGEATYRALARECLEKMWERRWFYRNALEEDAQNSLYENMWRRCVSLTAEELKGHIGTQKLSQELIDAVRFYYFGICGMIRVWLLSADPLPLDRLVDYHLDFMPEVLRAAYADRTDRGKN